MKNQRYNTVTKVFLTLVAFGHSNSRYVKVFFFPLTNGLPFLMFSLSKLKAYAKKDLRGILRIPQPTFTVFRLVFYLLVTPYV